jgi:arylsulfatase A-like enzyme
MRFQEPPVLKGPVLGLGLGFVSGAAEALKLSYTLLLELTFAEAFLGAFACVLLNGLLGLLFGLAGGAVAQFWPRSHYEANRHAIGMTVTAWMLCCWHILPMASTLVGQGRDGPAAAFVAITFLFSGMVWVNSLYWLRKVAVRGPPRHGWLRIATVLGLISALLAASNLEVRSYGSSRALLSDPDVLIVTVDALRRDHVSIYGEGRGQGTPAFDKVAAGCLLYEDAVSPSPSSRSSHAGMLTGVNPAYLGGSGKDIELPRVYKTLAERLEKEGYATAAFVSHRDLRSADGFSRGFELYDDDFLPGLRGLTQIQLTRWTMELLFKGELFQERAPGETTGRALRWMEENDERPAMVWLHLAGPRAPYLEPGGGDPEGHRELLSRGYGAEYSEEDQAGLVRLYEGEVSATDEAIGSFLDAVERLGPDRKRILVLAGAHGSMLGEHGQFSLTEGVFEPAVRIPLAVCPLRGDLRQGRVEEPARLLDLYNSILWQLKLPFAKGTQSSDIVRHLGTENYKGYSALLFGREINGLSEGPLFGYRARARNTGRPYKFVWRPQAARERLYSLNDDPGEETDLSTASPVVASALREAVFSAAKRSGLVEPPRKGEPELAAPGE